MIVNSSTAQFIINHHYRRRRRRRRRTMWSGLGCWNKWALGGLVNASVNVTQLVGCLIGPPTIKCQKQQHAYLGCSKRVLEQESGECQILFSFLSNGKAKAKEEKKKMSCPFAGWWTTTRRPSTRVRNTCVTSFQLLHTCRRKREGAMVEKLRQGGGDKRLLLLSRKKKKNNKNPRCWCVDRGAYNMEGGTKKSSFGRKKKWIVRRGILVMRMPLLVFVNLPSISS